MGTFLFGEAVEDFMDECVRNAASAKDSLLAKIAKPRESILCGFYSQFQRMGLDKTSAGYASMMYLAQLCQQGNKKALADWKHLAKIAERRPEISGILRSAVKMLVAAQRAKVSR